MSSSGLVKGTVGPTPWNVRYGQTGQFPFGGTAAAIHDKIMDQTKAEFLVEILKLKFLLWTAMIGTVSASLITAFILTRNFWAGVGSGYIMATITAYMTIYTRLDRHIIVPYACHYAGKPAYLFVICLLWPIGFMAIIGEHRLINDIKNKFVVEKVMES